MVGVLPREERTTAGIFFMILAIALFICVDTSAKWLFLAGINPIQTAFSRYAGQFIYGLIFFIPREGMTVFRAERPWMQILRSLCLLLSTVLNFFALSFLPITLTTTIMFSMPILITVLAIPILGEKVGLRRFIAVCVGFLGVVVVTQPWGAQWHPAMFLSFGAVTVAGFYFILTRLLVGTDSNATMQIWGSAFPTFVLLPFAVAFWVWPQNTIEWAVFLGIGLIALVSHGLATIAHRYAEAAILSPVIYTQIFFAAVSGVLVFNTWPTYHTLIGGMIIVASGLYIWLREQQLKD